jgi:hypothetical protein
MCACVLLSLARNICFIIKGVTSVIPASLWNMFLHYTNSSVYLSRFYKEKLRLKRLLFIWIWICFLFSFVQKAGAFPISGQTTTHYTIRKERGLPSDTPIIDKYAPSNNVRKDASPMILITGDKELEMLARYEENAHLYALLKALGQKTTLYQMEGFDHGTVAAPACTLINSYMKKAGKK